MNSLATTVTNIKTEKETGEKTPECERNTSCTTSDATSDIEFKYLSLFSPTPLVLPSWWPQGGPVRWFKAPSDHVHLQASCVSQCANSSLTKARFSLREGLPWLLHRCASSPSVLHPDTQTSKMRCLPRSPLA